MLRTPIVNALKYGAAYFPYLRTSLPFITDDASVTIVTHTVNGATGGPLESQVISASAVIDDETAIYNAVKQFVNRATVTLPPSGAVTGVYAQVDRNRGVSSRRPTSALPT